jgi:kynurenine formamidase
MSTTTRRWVQRPPGSNWGDFGDDDQLGRLNLITPERRRAAAAEVIDGLSFCLSLPLDYPGGNVLNPRRHPPKLRPTERGGMPNWMFEVGSELDGATDVINDDMAMIWLQYSTQWDSLAHAGSNFDANGDGRPEIVFYNGYRGGIEIPKPEGSGESLTSATRALGIDGMAKHGVQGRGVLVNLRKHCGDGREVVGYDRLMKIMEADRVVVETGDILCLYTGFTQRVLEWNKKPDPVAIHTLCSALDGRDEKLLQWITDSGIAALVADNYAVEHHSTDKPPGRCAMLPLHEHCLFKLGLPLGEIWYLHELATHLADIGRSRFMLTAPPLRLPGAVGSPVSPIATV